MHPTLLDLPFGISVKAYGLMMMLGFFAATWWAMYRAQKVKADPDAILNLGFISLICGIAGARLLYVYQYWNQDFAGRGLYAIIDITKGGLVFYGGFLLAVIGALVYLIWAKHSVRLYLDILAPSLMLGLAFGRVGCFLNGCCWGAPTERVPWAITFPYGSPPFNDHRNRSLVDVPQQLLAPDPNYFGGKMVLNRDHLNANIEVITGPQNRLDQAREALAAATRENAKPDRLAELTTQVKAAEQNLEKARKEYFDLFYAYEKFGHTPSEIAAMASQHRSAHVHPTQLYAVIDASLIALLLHAVFMRRKQQGMVFGLLFILYGAGRFAEELIRGDNPLDRSFGPLTLTISQMISVYTFLFAIVYLIIVYRLPAVPRTAVRLVPSETESQPAGK